MDNRRDFLKKATATILARISNLPAGALQQATKPAAPKPNYNWYTHGLSCDVNSRIVQGVLSGQQTSFGYSELQAVQRVANGGLLAERKKFAALKLYIRKLNLNDNEMAAIVDNISPFAEFRTVTNEAFGDNSSYRETVLKTIKSWYEQTAEATKAELSRIITREKALIEPARQFCTAYNIKLEASSPDLEPKYKWEGKDIILDKNIKLMTFPDMASAAKLLRGNVPHCVKVIIYNEKHSAEAKKQESWVEKLDNPEKGRTRT